MPPAHLTSPREPFQAEVMLLPTYLQREPEDEVSQTPRENNFRDVIGNENNYVLNHTQNSVL